MVGAAVWKVRVATGDSKSTEKKKKRRQEKEDSGLQGGGWRPTAKLPCSNGLQQASHSSAGATSL